MSHSRDTNPRSHALRNASEYYASGGNLDLSGAFFENLLRTDPMVNRPSNDLR
jgi:hypothetical protein